MRKNGRVDVVLITALRLECEAVLRHVDDATSHADDGELYHTGRIGPYDVVVMPLFGMGNIRAAAAATRAIAKWNPAHIMLVGVAGGVQKLNSRCLGDVLVADQVVDYEFGKVKPDRIEPRYQVYRPAKRLLDAAKNLHDDAWVPSVAVARPGALGVRTKPSVHFGVIASGQKVVADSSFVDGLRTDWTELIGLEMEGLGVALAAHESNQTPGFLLVKGISDWADADKNDGWQPYAADAAATFTAALLRSKPVTPVQQAGPHLADAPESCEGGLPLVGRDYEVDEPTGTQDPDAEIASHVTGSSTMAIPVSTRRWIVVTGVSSFLAVLGCGVVGFPLYQWWSGETRRKAEQKHTTLRYSGASLTYEQAAEMTKAAYGPAKAMENRLVDAHIHWTGFVTDSRSPSFYVIRPRKDGPVDKREEAIVTLRDPSTFVAYAKDEQITVEGRVSKVDRDGFDIVGAEVVPD
jgi:nucleoside phosphorylase